MNKMYKALSITRQAFHQGLNRELVHLEEEQQLLPIIREIRRDHPEMSARIMYLLVKPRTMGRDKFERFCFSNGFKVAMKRSLHVTTNSSGVIRFDNLTLTLELTGINQLWVSDITYYRIAEKFYYLTFITDQFSRLVVGYSVSKTLHTTETTIPALKHALERYAPSKSLILHSDGGGQYYCKQFIEITKQAGIRNSMGEQAYENPLAERMNGIIKNSYLRHYNPQTFEQLKTLCAKSVSMYNNFKPHSALNKLTPAAYYRLLTENVVINKEKRTKKEIYNITKLVN
jgi:putative transposase